MWKNPNPMWSKKIYCVSLPGSEVSFVVFTIWKSEWVCMLWAWVSYAHFQMSTYYLQTNSTISSDYGEISVSMNVRIVRLVILRSVKIQEERAVCFFLWLLLLWLISFKPTYQIIFLQVMGFGLFLMDNEACNINKLDQKKKLNLSKIDRIFKVIHDRFSFFFSILLNFHLYNINICYGRI